MRRRPNGVGPGPTFARSRLTSVHSRARRYTVQSSLGRQVLDVDRTSVAFSFGLEDRFDADRRERYNNFTPGPGAYRV